MRRTHRLFVTVAALAVVLGVGAVTAYAGLADDTTPPVTTSDAAASYWNDAVITLTATDDEGIAYIYHELDGGVVRLHTVAGAPTSATLATPLDRTGAHVTPSPGIHVLKFWAQDVNGNVEAQKQVTFEVKADHDAPVTVFSGAAASGIWGNHPVTVNLAASDGDGAGVARIVWVLDGGTPVAVDGAETDVAITTDGDHTLVFHAEDAVGNVEAEQSLPVRIDTVKPTPKAFATSATRGRTATLRYQVADPAPNGGTASGKLVVKNPAGKTVKTVRFAGKPVNVTVSAKFRVPLTWKAGTYRFYVYATDLAGNTQARIGVAKLVIK